MRTVHWLCETRSGRAVLRILRRTRLAREGWDPVPEAPHEVVGRIAPTPLLIVHGDADQYFPMPHLHVLRDNAPDAVVWVEEGMGHAESATTPELVQRIAAWLRAAVTSPAGMRRG
jgi:pimeloyl-ACP methyl ester carboxylesterase